MATSTTSVTPIEDSIRRKVAIAGFRVPDF